MYNAALVFCCILFIRVYIVYNVSSLHLLEMLRKFCFQYRVSIRDLNKAVLYLPRSVRRKLWHVAMALWHMV